MVEFVVPEPDYDRYSNRQLAAVPLAVLALALLVLAGWTLMTGTPVTPGIEFTGGTEIQIATDASQSEVRQSLDFEIDSVQPIAGSNEFIVTTQATDSNAIGSAARSAGYEVVSIQSRSASFGADAQRLALIGIGVAFVGMSLLIFVLFRSFVPSIAVVASAFSDIIIPLALMNVFQIKLSLGSVAALLMLIGYSVDSDILLNNHILRRRGSFYESTYRAMQTGVTMTVTSISAMTVMWIVSSLFGIPLLPDLAIVLVFGLVADLMNTYMLNLSLLRWYKYEGVAR
ncbi:preprotein translocase subunit SecF [Halosimplex carlsbadense 2-9-1]|uniref:Protein-export membrane protein SecF n=1 Tax=Halosimplex carlsbadense 2-9-1 TaxID=797114 RepID=M0D2E0_9EURY|nr:protein translocase subunit SecF [Halosimplex carlsbadense]ELZ29686.1 preprotein translocase subunit SecF [Halosimplex carlsbadense 2-9-1]